MWQRFTERARRVVFFSQEEAGRNGDNYVSTEHLLLGLLRESDNVAGLILTQLQVRPDDLRVLVKSEMSRSDNPIAQDMQLTPRAKRVIDLAYDEARQLNNNYIGTEHLLLGILREAEGLAGRVLLAFKLELPLVRQEVADLQNRHLAAKVASEATAEEKIAAKAALEPLPADSRETLNNLLSRRSGVRSVEKSADSQATESLQPGDLGVARASSGSTRVEMVPNTADFDRLTAIFATKDTHGYRAMAEGDQTLFLLPEATALKLLTNPVDGNLRAGSDGLYVRVLSGSYEGQAGWIFRCCFERVRSDDSDFPPVLEEK